MIVDPIVCDDIREELNGKVTLVGVYGDYLGVSSFPGLIPTFCVWWRAAEIKVSDLPSQVRLQVDSDAFKNEYAVELEIDHQSDDPESDETSIVFPFRLAALTLEQAGSIKLTTFFDGTKVHEKIVPIKDTSSTSPSVSAGAEPKGEI